MINVSQVAEAMTLYGGSFVQALGRALMQADNDNQRRIKETWPEYWAEYVDVAQKLELNRAREAQR